MEDEGVTRAIRATATGSGEAIFSLAIAERMMKCFSTRPSLPVSISPELTKTERPVLVLMTQDADNETIARQLPFTNKTVRKYVSNIFSKLQVEDRA
jgi:DNA-binding NarL/FixJ family response regulator